MEIWKNIDWSWWFYQISNTWIVKSLKFWKEKIKKQSMDWKWYLQVSIKINWKLKTLYIHRLVAIHYIWDPWCKMEVNHKDWDKTNNNVENLEWTTSSQNNKHRCNMAKSNKKLLEMIKERSWDDNFVLSVKQILWI